MNKRRCFPFSNLTSSAPSSSTSTPTSSSTDTRWHGPTVWINLQQFGYWKKNISLYIDTLFVSVSQIWRLITSFLFFGSLGFSFLFNIIFLYLFVISGRNISDYLWTLFCEPCDLDLTQVQILPDAGGRLFPGTDGRFCFHVPVRRSRDDCILPEAQSETQQTHKDTRSEFVHNRDVSISSRFAKLLGRGWSRRNLVASVLDYLYLLFDWKPSVYSIYSEMSSGVFICEIFICRPVR